MPPSPATKWDRNNVCFDIDQLLLTIGPHDVTSLRLETFVIAALSSILLVSGACFAYAALCRPKCQVMFERCGGALMVTGLGLLGTGLGLRP